MKTETKPAHTPTPTLWKVIYRPILAKKDSFPAEFYEADYKQDILIEAPTIVRAEKAFHEGNNGKIVDIILFDKQTPLPWKSEFSTIYGANSEIICSTIIRKDAAFIVRACNAYEEDQRIIRDLKEQLEILGKRVAQTVAAVAKAEATQ